MIIAGSHLEFGNERGPTTQNFLLYSRVLSVPVKLTCESAVNMIMH